MNKKEYFEEHKKICRKPKHKGSCAGGHWKMFVQTGDKRYLDPTGTHKISNPKKATS